MAPETNRLYPVIDLRNPVKIKVERFGDKLKDVLQEELQLLEREFSQNQLSQDDFDLLRSLLEHDLETLKLRLRLFQKA